MEYRIEIIKDRREMMDWFDVLMSLLTKMGMQGVARTSCGMCDVYLTIDDMNAWVAQAIDQYGKMKIVKDIDDKLTIILGHEML